MNTERIKEIQQETGYPESVSVQQALLKVWNECEQRQLRDLLPIIDDAGVAALNIAEKADPKLTAQEQSVFIAGFQECIKWLLLNNTNPQTK